MQTIGKLFMESRAQLSPRDEGLEAVRVLHAGEGRGLRTKAKVSEREQWLTKDCRQSAQRFECGSKECRESVLL